IGNFLMPDADRHEVRAASAWLLPRHGLPRMRRYGGAVLIALGIFAVEVGLASATGAVPLGVGLLAVIFSAWFFGRGPGLFTAGLYTCAGAYLQFSAFLPPGGRESTSAVSLGAFVV